jgi:toxin-antitoxin system PIN domain toxin
MFIVDTNVLVYAADPDSELHAQCRRRLEGWRQQASPWYLAWGICYEFLRLCSHPRIFRRPWTIAQGWEFLASILDSPAGGLLLPTLQHENVLREIIAEVPHLRGNIVHDLHTAALMREHGIRDIYTRDSDFSRFPFVKVIDPLA